MTNQIKKKFSMDKNSIKTSCWADHPKRKYSVLKLILLKGHIATNLNELFKICQVYYSDFHLSFSKFVCCEAIMNDGMQSMSA